MNTTLKYPAAALLAVALGGCLFSSGPSESEALNAIVMEHELGNMASIYKYSQFQLSECKDAVGKPGYVCEVSWMYNGMYPRRETMRFVQDGSTWRVAEEE